MKMIDVDEIEIKPNGRMNVKLSINGLLIESYLDKFKNKLGEQILIDDDKLDDILRG